MPRRDAALLLEDIRSAIARIERYTSGLQREQFLADEKTVDAVARNLEIIGEAVRWLPANFMRKHEGIPWAADRRTAQSNRARLLRSGFGDHLASLANGTARTQRAARAHHALT